MLLAYIVLIIVVFQLMKFALKDFCGIEYTELKHRIGLSQQNTHSFVIKELGNEIIKKDRHTYIEFSRKIKDLKTFRTDSDYENTEIIFDQGQKAYNLAGEIRSLLIENLHL